MSFCKNTPLYDGYSMPAEFSEHLGTVFVFPERSGSWRYGATLARPIFCELIKALCPDETVYLAVSKRSKQAASKMLEKEISSNQVKLLDIETDDAWARDITPSFVKSGDNVRAVNWSFNAWGGDYNGLYADYKSDDAFANKLADKLGYKIYDAAPFVLEGGSIHTDGEGTLITTKACLLSKGRNPNMSIFEIEETLKRYLGIKKVIWLPNGIDGDETDEHVDNFCAFCDVGKVVLAWEQDETTLQGKYCRNALDILQNETDANGRKIEVIKLPLPKKSVKVEIDDLSGFEFAQGEANRFVGEGLAASYVNFYIGNKVVLLPQFGDENDLIAKDIIAKLFPTRKVFAINTREILLGGGNIHCITGQIPKGNKE